MFFLLLLFVLDILFISVTRPSRTVRFMGETHIHQREGGKRDGRAKKQGVNRKRKRSVVPSLRASWSVPPFPQASVCPVFLEIRSQGVHSQTKKHGTKQPLSWLPSSLRVRSNRNFPPLAFYCSAQQSEGSPVDEDRVLGPRNSSVLIRPPSRGTSMYEIECMDTHRLDPPRNFSGFIIVKQHASSGILVEFWSVAGLTGHLCEKGKAAFARQPMSRCRNE